jgi:hypothetical protein
MEVVVVLLPSQLVAGRLSGNLYRGYRPFVLERSEVAVHGRDSQFRDMLAGRIEQLLGA